MLKVKHFFMGAQQVFYSLSIFCPTFSTISNQSESKTKCVNSCIFYNKNK